MKRYRLYILTAAAVFISVASCKRDIEEYKMSNQLNPANIDTTGGTWKPVHLNAPTDIVMPAPKDVASAEFLAEIADVKRIAAGKNGSQKDAIQYWSVGGVLRWNEIMRELMAKYNVPPGYNEDGSYPTPSPANPNAYPQFPFANPPYAARAYALVSAAIYDALVVTWHYKMQYKRPAPYKVDGGIDVDVPQTNLPSWPSEDATIAAAACEVMKLLFPGEVGYLNSKAQEHKNSRLWAGANVMSDIAAGDSIGRKVGALIVARAKTDGAGSAGGNKKVWDSLANTAVTRGEIAWKSLEVPARPPMLPLFCNVKMWVCTPADLQAQRAMCVPPSVHSQEFKDALAEVKHYSKKITREQFRIVSFWADGAGTYTPPGHWNFIATDLIYKRQYSEIRTARALCYMNLAMFDAAVVCWDLKFYYMVPRPSQMDPEIKTATGVPNFPAFTSGHSSFSSAAATVLGYIMPEESGQLWGQAVEASMSRLYGSIHYRFDCDGGLKSGRSVGDMVKAKAMADGCPNL